MKRAILGSLVAYSVFAAGLFASAPIRPNPFVHKAVGVVKSVSDHRIIIEAVVNGNKEDIDLHIGRFPVGVANGEKVQAFYRMIGTDRIGFHFEAMP